MRCEEVENDIAEFLSGTLSEKSRLLEHLAVCPRCRTEVEELQTTWMDLEHVDVPQTSSVMSAGVLAALNEIEPKFPIRRKPVPYVLKPILLSIVSVVAAVFLGHSLSEISREATIKDSTAGHFRGSPNVPLTLVEYGDYQCPPCASYNSVINEVLKRYADKVRLEYRHFPLLPVHPNALAAAVAAEAAGEQGRYWEMHDALFSSQQRWAKSESPEKEFIALAAGIGLDTTRFSQALQAPELRERVLGDITTGREAQVQATPTFFLRGKVVSEVPLTVEGLLALIDGQLRK